ncbi:hypothetical protein BDF14DRAFT_1885232 [Spinellus fusiger]|nr:hypothetical protein BDF14DRAFT_1885232 [Spinellus fusiger]
MAIAKDTHEQQRQTLQEKLELIYEKRLEFDTLSHTKTMSDTFVLCFESIYSSLQQLSYGTASLSQTLENWDHVFRIMSMISPHPPFSNPTLVRLPKKE